MGMSASQVRFLSLQHRKHNIGTQLTTLANRKMDLSRDMNRVSRNYTNALNQNVLKWSNDSGVTYNTLNYDLMMSPNAVNACTPYIVTDAKSGRVVLNNDTITDYQGNKITDPNTGEEITYVKLAEMISSYSGMDRNSNLLYERPANYTDGDGVVGGAKSIDNAYYIPDATKDYDFDNCLRYAIFEKLGLVTPQQRAKQISLLNALYGSPEAKESGIYPVGSAWGDYYLALANQQAYDEFISTQHRQAISDATKGSQNLVRTYAEFSNNYTYTATVNGDDGHSEYTQKSILATEHVDFKAITYSSADGFVTTYKEDGGSDWTNAATAAYGATSSSETGTYDYAFTDEVTTTSGAGSNYNEIYKINVSEDGVSYYYNMDDIVNKYLVSHGAMATTTNRDDVINVNNAFTNSGAPYAIVTNDRVNEYYLGENNTRGKFYNALKPYFTQLKDSIKQVLTAQNVTVNETALNRAYERTLERFGKESYDNDQGGSIAEDGDAVNDANTQKTVGEITRSYWYAYWIGVHRAHTLTSFDATSAFNVMMTYYQDEIASATTSDGDVGSITPSGALSQEGFSNDGLASTFAEKKITNPSGVITDHYMSETQSITENGLNIVKVTYTGLANNESSTPASVQENGESTAGKVFTVSSGTASYDADGNNPYGLKDGSTYNSGFIKYYKGYQLVPSKDSTVTYVKNGSGFGTFEWLDSASGTNVQVIGYVTKQVDVSGTPCERTYIFKQGDESALQKYLDNPTTSNLPSYYVDVPVAITVSNQTLDGDSDDNLELNLYRSASTLAIAVSGMIDECEQHSDNLKQAVAAALERIHDLEADLETFYSGADQKLMDFYDALFLNISKNGWMVDDRTSSKNNSNVKYLNNKLQNNDYFVTVCEEKADYTGFNYTTKQAVNVTKIYQVRDEDSENVALAEYEAEKTLISSKERRIDARMQKLETEQEAITTEMESIKKVRNDNIERTFKIFG